MGPIFYYSSVIVPNEALLDFKATIIRYKGKILQEASADASVCYSILNEVAQFYQGLSRKKLISRIVQIEKFNLDAGKRRYVQRLVKGLIKKGRLLIPADKSIVTVNPEEPSWANNEIYRLHNQLLCNIRGNLDRTEKLLDRAQSRWGQQDILYRFYHHSFKVYAVQETTKEIVTILRSLDPRPGSRPFNKWFESILNEGTGKSWDLSHNAKWLEHTRPMIEAFYHALIFGLIHPDFLCLDLRCRYRPDGLKRISARHDLLGLERT